jgi:hypothetical protein
MSDKEFTFTPEEISVIDKNLGFIVFDWAKHLINHILSQARTKGIKSVYMNTPDTLNSGNTQEGKVEYFYEKLPPMLGFKEEKIDLRGQGEERMWGIHFAKIISEAMYFLMKISQKIFTIQDIPSKYQGAVLGIIGKKSNYTLEEIRKVIGIIESRKNKSNQNKSMSKFYYDWSKEWSGGQRFHSGINENVVLQKIPSEVQDFINENPTLTKFWAYVLSQSGHFGSDAMGFALISKINNDIWVINEIQTDCLNAYLKIRGSLYKDKSSKGNKLDWNTVKDMLEANNRSKWISILENNEPMKLQIINDPSIINQLPDNSQDVDKWIEERKREMREMGATQGLDLMRHFQSVNFNSRIFKIY